MANARELTVNNIALAYYAARRSGYIRALDFDERVSTAMLGLVKAANSFEPDKGAQFHTYALSVIQNELNMELRLLNSYKRTVVMFPLGDDVEEEYRSAEDEAISHMSVKAGRASLTPREKRVAALRICGSSQLAIAAAEGVTQATVSRILKRMKAKFQ